MQSKQSDFVADTSDTIPDHNTDDEKEIDEKWCMKIHYHLGHCDIGVIARLCQRSGYKLNRQEAEKWIATCPCARNDRLPQMPNVGRHISSYPGEVVLLDITYLLEMQAQSSPTLLMTCPLTRFICCAFLKNMRPTTILSVFLSVWVSIFSYPKLILTDHGTSFSGVCWEDFCDTYGVALSSVPIAAPNQLGACEKQSHLLKLGFQAVRRYLPESWSNSMVLAITCASHNITPLSIGGLTPLFMTTGRVTEIVPIKSDGNDDVADRGFFSNSSMIARVRAMEIARETMAQADSRYILNTANKSVLRTGAKDVFTLGERVLRWGPKNKRWRDGYRVLADVSRNVIIELGSKLFKTPRQRLKKSACTQDSNKACGDHKDQSIG